MSTRRSERKQSSKKQWLKYSDERKLQFSKSKEINSIKTLLKRGKYSKALVTVHDYLERYPNDSYGLLQEANILYTLGVEANNYDEAVEKYQYIIENRLESQYAARYKLALIESKRGNYEEACELYQENIRLSPYKEVYSIYELMKIKHSFGKFDEAITIYENCSCKDEDEIVLIYCNILRSLDRINEAKNVLEDHDFTDRDDILDMYYCEKSSNENYCKNYDKAIEYLYKARNYASAFRCDMIDVDIAFAHFKNHDYREAYDMCRKLSESKILKVKRKTHSLLGRMYIKMGLHDLAMEEYEIALENCFDYDPRAYLDIGDVYLLEKDFDKAKEYYLKYILESKNVEYANSARLKLALATYKENDLNGAKELLQKVNYSKLINANKKLYDLCQIGLNINNYKNCDTLPSVIDAICNYNIYKVTNAIYDSDIELNESINIRRLLANSEELISKGTLIENFFFDIYCVRYDNVGYDKGKVSNTLEIYVSPHTTNIVGMKVISDIPILNYTENSKQKLMQKSNIDKFYEKYGFNNKD